MEPKIKAVEAWKREVLSPYCLGSCSGKCCSLEEYPLADLTREQVNLLYGKEDPGPIKDIRKRGMITEKPLLFRKRYILRAPVCPRYDEESRTCTVHEHPLRPEGCAVFPVQVFPEEAKYMFSIFLSKKCELVSRSHAETADYFSRLPFVKKVISGR